MISATYSTPIASASRPVILSDSSLSLPLNTDELEAPTESSLSTSRLIDTSEDSEGDDAISEDGPDKDESTSSSSASNGCVERALKEMRGANLKEKASLVHGLLPGSNVDKLAELLATVLRRKRVGMDQLLVAWASSSTGHKKKRVRQLQKALRAKPLKKALEEEDNLPVVVKKVRNEWKKLVQSSDYFGKEVSCLQPDRLDISEVFSQLEDIAPTWSQLFKSICVPKRPKRSAWSSNTDVPVLVQRKLIFLTILGLGIYQSHTAVGFRTQLGIYLKQNGLHQRAIDVLSRLGITTGSNAIGTEMKRMEQAAKASTTYIFPLARAYDCRIGVTVPNQPLPANPNSRVYSFVHSALRSLPLCATSDQCHHRIKLRVHVRYRISSDAGEVEDSNCN